ncbi:hypothetical protein K6T82_08120 [Flavobacterium sp. 17A]|uniref:CD-NTase-associated protein 16 NUDIX domain-containing protein n=1 Tax=Flavobacterium potami TaxID=2872310 RepID=A0A9X1H8M5_9FLAO|nr:hypothetical protein [Flavobacterium potami]MBZ4034728.1 hypothetical protein [Flavobacterium potami]
MKGKVSFILGVIGIAIYFILSDTYRGAKDTILKISIGFLVAVVVDLLVFLVENRKKWNIIKTLFIKPNKEVRVTVAYLFRIEVNGKYALIKRHKKDRIGYQPIGGAFKYFKEENRECFDKLGIEPCNYVERDEDTDSDLRIRINKRKNLGKFLKWFESRKNREVDPWREFYEELVEPGILSSDLFKHVKYVFVGKHCEGIFPARAFPIDEFRYAEIYELRPDTEAQKNAIAEMKNSDQIIFVTPDEIRNGSINGLTILPHSFKILPR